MKIPRRREPAQKSFWNGRELVLMQKGRREHFAHLEAKARSQALAGMRKADQNIWVKYVGGRK